MSHNFNIQQNAGNYNYNYNYTTEQFAQMRNRMTGSQNGRYQNVDTATVSSQQSSGQSSQRRGFIQVPPYSITQANGQLRSNIDHYLQQHVPSPQQLLQYPHRPQIAATAAAHPSAQQLSSADQPQPKAANYYHLNPQLLTQQIHPQRIVANIEQSKAVAKQKLNAIAPVEYVNNIRKLSKPMLENKKLLQSLDQLKKVKKRPLKAKYYFIFGTWVMVFSLFMFAVQDEIIRQTMNYVMGELNENSIVTKNWQDVPVPINFCIYLMGLRNGEAFTQGARPNIVEHGPFCYLLNRQRRVIEWKKNTVRYMERMKFKFDPDNSKSLSTKVDMINYPIFIAVGFAKNLLETFHISFIGPLVYNGITIALRMTGEGLVDHTTARELLEGKRIAILEYVDLFLQPIRTVGVPIPKYFGAGGLQLLNHSFGFTTTLGSGEVGPYEVYRRTENGHLVGDILSFQEKSTFPTWNAPCNIMRGGDGMFWRRPIEAERLSLYISIACRLIPFVKDETHYFQGAQVVRYLLDPQMFNMSYRRNQCFCYKRKSLRDCEGFHDISPCLGWLPVGFSFPHFYNSPNLLRKVDGLTPSAEEHQGYLDMEPLIAAPVNARIGIQGLIDIQPLSLVPSLSDMPRVKLPIVYFKIHAGANGFLAVLLCVGSNAVRYGSYAWLVGGLGFSALLFALGNRCRIRQKSVN